MKKIIVLLLMFAVLPLVNAVCVTPSENMEIKENAVFCSGIYNIENGIKVLNDSITIDCDNSILIGNGVGFGILLKEKQNVIVQNCNISNYEIGIYLDNTNNSIIKNNYLTKNKFGIALLNSFNNNINDNVFSENINSNQVIYLQTQLPQQEVIEPAKEKAITSKDVIEEVIKIKKPFSEQSEIVEEVNSIFNKYFDITQENLEISRTIFYNETDKTTTIILQLKPKKILLNLSVYEKIPKCVSNYVNEILFKTGGYEVIKDDPLILWYFAKLDNDKELSYKVFKSIDDGCKNLLLAFGIATGFEEKLKEREKSKANYLLIFSIIVAVVVILYFILIKREK